MKCIAIALEHLVGYVDLNGWVWNLSLEIRSYKK